MIDVEVQHIMRFFKSALSCLVVLTSVLAKSSAGDKVLVLLDPSLDKANYSIFFNGLERESRCTHALLLLTVHPQNAGMS